MRRSKAKSCSLLDLCSPTKSGLQGAKPCRYGRPPHHLLLPVPAVKSPPCCLVGQGSAIRCYGRRKSKQTFTPTRLLFALNSVSSGKDEKCLALQRVSLQSCSIVLGWRPESQGRAGIRLYGHHASRLASMLAGRNISQWLWQHIKKGNHHLKKKKIKEEIHLITEGKIPSNLAWAKRKASEERLVLGILPSIEDGQGTALWFPL